MTKYSFRPSQQRAAGAYRDSNTVIFDGPPGVGKTFWLLHHAIWLMERRPKGSNLGIIAAANYRNVINRFHPYVASGELGDWNHANGALTLPDGGEIWFRNAESQIDKLMSVNCYVLGIDNYDEIKRYDLARLLRRQRDPMLGAGYTLLTTDTSDLFLCNPQMVYAHRLEAGPHYSNQPKRYNLASVKAGDPLLFLYSPEAILACTFVASESPECSTIEIQGVKQTVPNEDLFFTREEVQVHLNTTT